VSASQPVPAALTIAGSDSGGGAGIQADLKTFTSLGVHGTTAITCLTAQSPAKVSKVRPCSPALVRAQIEGVFEELRPQAVKTGMLYSAEIVRAVVDWYRSGRRPPLVVDPVMMAGSGAALVKNSRRGRWLDDLLPLASLVTPNLDETGVLLALDGPRSVEEMRQAARQIHARFGCAALVKGGHLRGVRQAIDIFYDGKTELLLHAPFARGVSTHGTGCTYSAAVTAYLARGRGLARSVELAKEYVTQAIFQSYTVGRHRALNSFWHYPRPRGPQRP
jgi:hydroxymethylpyrimidine/phosphomethylpyrimidine kinase